MINYEIKKYVTTAEAAFELGLSIGSIQKLVNSGELEAMRTQGGHRRIFINSIEEYREAHRYHKPLIGGKICILHQGDDLDPILVQNHDPKVIQLMAHPLDLLGMKKKDIGVLFIDARNTWLRTAAEMLLDELKINCIIFVYNSKNLPKDSHLIKMKYVHLICENINAHFISGYDVGRVFAKM